MKKIHEISKQFQEVYDYYFENNGSPESAIERVNIFLKKYPYYSEAIIFKARMLIAIEKHKEALKLLKTAELIDRWRLDGKFDKAEVLLELNKKEESLELAADTINSYLKELQSGIESYVLSMDNQAIQKELEEVIFQHISLFFAKADDQEATMQNLKEYLLNNKGKINPTV